MSKILFTGGGSAGHVTPNIAIIDALKAQNCDIAYIGSHNGIEKKLINNISIPYYAISTGKLRRYFSWQNFIDPFKLVLGIIKSTWLCRRLKPQLVFSKGGFVSLPVVIGAWLNRIPVILHESDLTPGLANKLCAPFAKKICLTFEETKKYMKNKDKLIVTGTPIRAELFSGDKSRGLNFTQLSTDKQIILVICGSLGSKKINEALRNALPDLLKHYAVIHVCGKGNLVETDYMSYKQFEYLTDQYADVLACADMVVSRSGANSLYELLAIKKPHLLIPLSKAASRGDQIVNAKHFSARGLSRVLFEEELNADTLTKSINQLNDDLKQLQEKLNAFNANNATQPIVKLISTILFADQAY